MTALYIITRFLTFPGSLMRGFWEQIICRIHKVPVEDNRYLRNDEMCSHVEHEFMGGAAGAFAVCFVPMLLQLILAFIVSFASILNIYYLGIFSFPKSIIDILCLYIGFSLTVNCFPSVEDAMNMIEKIYKGKTNILVKIIFAPGAAVCYAGAFTERYCVTFLSTVCLTLFLIFLI